MTTSLFEDSVLEDVEESGADVGLEPVRPGPDFRLRSLSLADYDSGYLEVLQELTRVGDISLEQFTETFMKMRAVADTYFVTVVEEVRSGRVVGAGTLLIEHKFIHQCALRGRIEDVVVSRDYRGKQLGKVIIRTLTLLARKLKCYKLTLDCRDEMRPFYQSLGFRREEANSNFMQLRFTD